MPVVVPTAAQHPEPQNHRIPKQAHVSSSSLKTTRVQGPDATACDLGQRTRSRSGTKAGRWYFAFGGANEAGRAAARKPGGGLLVTSLEKRKFAAHGALPQTRRPRKSPPATAAARGRSEASPSPLRRGDESKETPELRDGSPLPRRRGSARDVDLTLRCAAHNRLAAEERFRSKPYGRSTRCCAARVAESTGRR